MSILLGSSGASVILGSSGGSVMLVPDPGASAIANNEHPRLLMTASAYDASIPTVAAIKARCADAGGTGWKTEYAALVADMDSRIGTGRPSNWTLRAYEVFGLAFVYATYGTTGITYGNSQTTYSDRAIDCLLDAEAAGAADAYYPGCLLPISYDWLHAAMTSGERATISAWLISSVDTGSPSVEVPGNPFNSQVVVKRCLKILTALAAAGDGTDETWCTATLAKWDDYFRSDASHARAESQLGGDEGDTGQGTLYGWAYSWPVSLFAEEGYRTAYNISRSTHYLDADARYLKTTMRAMAHISLPHAPSDGTKPGGYRYTMWRGPYAGWRTWTADEHRLTLPMLRAAYDGVDQDAANLAQWLITNRTGVNTGVVDYVLSCLIGSKSVTAESPSTIGLSPIEACTSGRFMFRPQWEANGADGTPLVTFTAAKWGEAGAAGTMYYNGHFTVDRKGPQIITRGSATSGHEYHYQGNRNTLAFPDRTITAPRSAYDTHGTVRWNGDSSSVADWVEDSVFDYLGDATRSRLSGDVSYVLADLTRSYDMGGTTQFGSSTTDNPPRVTKVVRHFIYFHPATPGTDSERILVFDRYTLTSTDFTPTFMLGTAGVPIVDGTETANSPSRNGTGHGHWSYAGATTITASNTAQGSDGLTVVTCLLPTSRTIVKAGGPNESGAWWQTSGTLSCEFIDLYGERHARYGDISTGSEMELYAGRYHVQVSPSSVATDGVFAHAIEVGDSSMTPATVHAITGSGWGGGGIGSRLGVFGLDGESKTSGTFVLPDVSGTYKLLIGSLAVNTTRTLTPGASVTIEGSGSAYAASSGASGSFYVTVVITAGGNTASRTVTVS